MLTRLIGGGTAELRVETGRWTGLESEKGSSYILVQAATARRVGYEASWLKLVRLHSHHVRTTTTTILLAVINWNDDVEVGMSLYFLNFLSLHITVKIHHGQKHTTARAPGH